MDDKHFPMAEHWAYMTPEWLQNKEREYYAKVAPKLERKHSRKKGRPDGSAKVTVTNRPGKLYVKFEKSHYVPHTEK